MKNITQERVRSLLHYNQDTGILTWKETRGSIHAGDRVRHKSNRGYIQVRIDKKLYMAHRIIWLYVNGYMPENDIDHINRVRDDNRLCNLREVARVCNCRNSGMQCNNTSGIIGVSWFSRDKKWKVQIKADGKGRHIGYYDTKLEAAKARWEAEKHYKFPNCNTTSSAYEYLKKHGAI